MCHQNTPYYYDELIASMLIDLMFRAGITGNDFYLRKVEENFPNF